MCLGILRLFTCYNLASTLPLLHSGWVMKALKPPMFTSKSTWLTKNRRFKNWHPWKDSSLVSQQMTPSFPF